MSKSSPIGRLDALHRLLNLTPGARGRQPDFEPSAAVIPGPRPRSAPAPLDVAGALAGERILITGATGFIGKVLVEKLLRSVPEVGKLLLLVRPARDRSAGERLRDEVLGSPIMAHLRALHAADWGAWAADKVEVVAGDLAQDRLGLDQARYTALCTGVDRVVASAATVTFDERLDRALELNARGAGRTLQLARDAGDVPLLQVSTCFVSGRRQGWVPERVAEIGDLDRDLAEAAMICARLEDEAAPGEAFVAAGAELADRHGFHDVYTFTKALGERLLARDRGAVPVAIVRPAIVESAAAQPIPGWIEAVRVADPLLVAYGRGRTRDIPGAADAALELIPVDFVVHAMLAALADLSPGSPVEEKVPVYQVASSRHPITLGELMSYAREGFAGTPLRDGKDRPIEVAEARFVEPERLRRKLVARRRRTNPAERRMLDHFIRLIEVYRPYFDRAAPGHRARYRDDATRALWHRLPAASRRAFPFDVSDLDWRSYVAGTHVPGIVRFALKAETGAPAPPRARADRPAASAESVAAGARNLFELFTVAALAHPDTIAFQTCRGGCWLRYTYRQALTATANLAGALARRFQVEPGDRVVLWSSGRPEWALATFAVHRLGAVTVPLDPQWPAEEAVAAARLVEAKLICAAPHLLESLDGKLDGSDCEAVALAAPLVPEPDVGLLEVTGRDAETMGAGPDRLNGSGALVRDSQDLASIIFTSGTTVAPRAVPLTHGNYLANVRDLVPLMRLRNERLLSVLPIHHVFEQMVGLLVPLAGGSTISYVAEIKPAEINWMMNVTRPTVLVAVPRLLELLHGGIMANVAAGGPALGALFKVLFALSRATGARFGHRLFAKVHRRFGGALRRIATGGSALEPSLGRSFQLMGFQVAEGYGMTETSPVLTVNPWQEIRLGSVGKPLPGVEIELRPPAGTAGGGEGEIWVRGANVMTGYYLSPEATAQVMADGWLNTGDVGFFDDDGYLHISGRTKDVIVTAAGKNVYPEEVERRYRGLPGVEELVVLGLPAEGGGERVCALIVPRARATGGDIERIRAAVAERSAGVPSYQQVANTVIWRGDLPKTTTMKIKRAVLRDAVVAGERGDGDGKPAPAPPPAPEQVSYSEAETWVLETLARLTRTRAGLLSAGDRLADLGIDSLTRVELIGAIEERFDLRLDDASAAGVDRVQDLFELL